jgi:hypothetical protein
MRYNTSFHPEWGYLAPASSFIRSVRMVFIATAVGAAVGAGVGFSWIGHGAESSVAARTLVRPMKAAPTPANTLAQVPNEPRARPTIGAKEGIAARSEVPAATDEPATAVTAAPPTTTKQAAVKAPVKKNATKKPNVTWRFALRDEPVELVPRQYHSRRSGDEFASEAGGRYRDGGRWGGSYTNNNGRHYLNW